MPHVFLDSHACKSGYVNFQHLYFFFNLLSLPIRPINSFNQLIFCFVNRFQRRTHTNTDTKLQFIPAIFVNERSLDLRNDPYGYLGHLIIRSRLFFCRKLLTVFIEKRVINSIVHCIAKSSNDIARARCLSKTFKCQVSIEDN